MYNILFSYIVFKHGRTFWEQIDIILKLKVVLKKEYVIVYMFAHFHVKQSKLVKVKFSTSWGES